MSLSRILYVPLDFRLQEKRNPLIQASEHSVRISLWSWASVYLSGLCFFIRRVNICEYRLRKIFKTNVLVL